MTRELLDQIWHVLFGCGVVLLLIVLMSAPWAFGAMMAMALLRELWQHRARRIGPRSMLDLAMFAVGGSLALWMQGSWLAA